MPSSQLVCLAQAVAPEQLQPLMHRPVTGWVLAAGVLVAARLGRSAAEAQRFDLAHLQVVTQLLSWATSCRGVQHVLMSANSYD